MNEKLLEDDMKPKKQIFKLILLILFCGALFGIHASGSVKGVITDALTGEPLFGANVFIEGTSLGSATDNEGRYTIRRIPPGQYNLKISYIGYQPKTERISIVSGRTVEVDVTLTYDLIEGDEVLITAQALGQAAAINQQLSSNTIVNVVSKDRIQELPDQNAAESVGRLPGISIERDAGEGTKVIVRGLAPKFNSITVNGERLPATDAQNRSVDLSMISSDMLEGIEVYKALTPDRDADAVGGTVNFVIKKAPKGFNGTVSSMGGYNNHDADYGNYRGNVSASNRFFDDKLGVLVTGNLQRANRSSDILDASYSFTREKREGEERAVISVENLNLGDRTEIRDRYGASLSLDYDLPNGSIVLSSLYGRTDRDEQRQRKRYRVGASFVEYWLRNRQINTDLFTNTLRGEHNFDFVKIDWRTSYSHTKRDMPRSHDSQFQELAAFTNDLIDDKGPELIPLGARNNLDETFFKQDFLESEVTKDNDITGQVDLTFPYRFADNLSGNLKLGGKFREKSRDRDKSQYMTLAFTINEIGAAHPDLFETTREGKIKLSNFWLPNYDARNFLNGSYEFPIGLDKDKLDKFLEDWRDYYVNSGFMDLEDYKASETIYAGYLMTEINIGPNLLILPGFRVESTVNDYKSIWGDVYLDENGLTKFVAAVDTTGSRTYTEFLPMVHIRYKFTPWFDARVAVTKSLSRPDYFNLVPWERIEHLENTVERGDPNLKHTTVWNYDLFLSFYSNLGLLTLGGYYKTLENIDYLRTSRITEAGATRGYQLIMPVNSEEKTEVYGFEVDLQTNLRFLPNPFDGIVLNANFSWIKSETFYPLLVVGPRSPVPPFQAQIIDSSRAGRMPGQSDFIANLSLGYEKGGFSGRISMVYQGNALQTVGSRSELDAFTDEYVRWDISAQYELFNNLHLIANFNNIINQPEQSFLGIERFSTRQEYFGWTADFGIKYKF